MDQPPIDIVKIVRVGGLLSALIVLVVTFFVVRVATTTLHGIGERFTHRRLMLAQVSTLLNFALWLAGIGVAFSFAVQLSREVVLALTGTAAVTIGLALKDLAASVLAGVIIILDRPFQVGDRVNFAGTYGEIRAIGLRSVRLITLDDNVVTIPNNKFLTDVVASGNWGALDMQIQMDFFIGADQDVALAKALVTECLISNRYVYSKKPWLVQINQVLEGNYVAVRLRAEAYVLDVQYEKEFQTDVTERALAAFATHGIQPPAVLHRGLPPMSRERVASAATRAS